MERFIKPDILAMEAYTLKPHAYRHKMNQNENPFGYPDDLKAIVLERVVQADWARYPSFTLDELREALAAHNGVSREMVLVGNGSNELIYVTLAATLRTGDHVVIPVPTFSMYGLLARLFGAHLHTIPMPPETNFALPVESIIETVQRYQARVVVLCTPHNPTGRVWRPEELRQVCAICARHDVLLISDEIHLDIVYPPHQFTATLGIYAPLGDNVIMVSSAGKSFGIPGLVSSYLFTPNTAIRTTIQKYIQRYHLDKSNAFGNTAMATVYRQGSDWLNSMISYLQGNIDYVGDFLRNELPAVRFHPPEGTYQLWLDMRSLGLDNQQLSRFLTEEAGLALNPGYSYGPGGDGFARMNIASPRSLIRQGMEQLAAAVKRLPGRLVAED